MKAKAVIKGIISYILALTLSVIFALYLNANVGWFMLIALILAPVMSVFFAWLSGKTVSVQCSMDECTLYKGDTCEMEVTVSNRSIFPTTPIELVVLNGEGVRSKEKSILCTVLPMSKQKMTIEFRANISGPSKVGIDHINITDYLGIFKFKLKRVKQESLYRNIAVIPDIADISLKDDRILKIMQASRNADDSEDTVEAGANVFGGFPGYDSREYVPGDPIKRINWKQSAKRNKLFVRLDDEMASKSVNVVLDSVFERHNIDITDIGILNQYGQWSEEQALPKIAEDAVENALGIISALILSSYTINFYVKKDNSFAGYVIEDEKDIESVRIALAEYSFADREGKERFPEDITGNNTTFVLSSPNSYGSVCAALEDKTDISNASVFSVIEDIKSNKNIEPLIQSSRQEDNGNNIKQAAAQMAIPCILALVLSVAVFSVFKISPLSYWTLIQAVGCVLAFALCSYAKKHKLVGAMLISIIVVGLLWIFAVIARSGGGYIQWFMSGGDLIENTFVYLLSIVLVLTVFFSMVIFYYTQVRYRTSAVLLTSIIPFVIYVKVMRDIDIKYVMLVIMLNVLVFLVNTRKRKDKNKRIAGFYQGVLSVVFYTIVFAMIALAVPKSQETKYYYIFEELFLGGNTSTKLPDEYMRNSKYSGNADNFNQLTNRKLYVILGIATDRPMYLKRQVFDYYDFENDRWYSDEYYSEYIYSGDEWYSDRSELETDKLVKAMAMAEALKPGFLEKYGLSELVNVEFGQEIKTMYITAENFDSSYYIAPALTLQILEESGIGGGENIVVTPHGTFGNKYGQISGNVRYRVMFYDEFQIKEQWTQYGGADLDRETAIEMLQELLEIYEENRESLYIFNVNAFLEQALYAAEYCQACRENVEEIPEKVKELALDITKDCQYDWEKAEALQDYFEKSNFVYDLSYDAPDDSVEYFLFEGKTGTCSDFASAYVLMARAAGLTARYVEGFVPTREEGLQYSYQYVVRTSSSHAYAEVYIQNLGFVVYEPTRAAVYVSSEFDGGAVQFVMTLGYRILLVFFAVSFMIIVILFMSRILLPVVNEKRFMVKVKKAEAGRAVTMLYKRILSKYSKKYIENPSANTPYEYAEKFERIMECDISPIIYMVEQSVYENKSLSEADKKVAVDIYMQAGQAAKARKK